MEVEPRGFSGRPPIVREGTAHGRPVPPHDLGFRITPAFEPSFQWAHPTDTLLQCFLGMAVSFIDGLGGFTQIMELT